MTTMATARMDLSTRWKLLRFQRLLAHNTDSLTARFGATETAVMRREMVDEYRALLPEVPDIGGRHNPWASNLAGCVWALAVYRVVLRHGGSAQDAGRVAYDYARGMMARVPKPLRGWMGPRPARARKVARWTQQRRYPDDWVAEFVEGSGQPFDFGMDVTQCAIVRYMHAHDADELTPWLCSLDYVMAEATGHTLTRTKTLAWGCDRCDFRFTRGSTATASWPPEFAERTCGRPAA